jgi:hypothetical protein
MSEKTPALPDLSRQRCFNHFQREAAARCLECRQFFCRECITEHDDRIVCAACLRKLARQPLLRRRGFASTLRLGQCLAGLLALWFCFYLVGEWLIAIPTAFHEGTLWQVNWLDKE